MTSEFSNAHDHIDPNINAELVGYAGYRTYKQMTAMTKKKAKL
jgi:hypothetical protein